MIQLNEYLINKHTKSKFDYPCYILLDAIKKYQKRMSKAKFYSSKTCSIYFDDYTSGWGFSQKTEDGVDEYRLVNIFYDPALEDYLICGYPLEDDGDEDTSLDFDETIQMDKQTVDELVKIINQKND